MQTHGGRRRIMSETPKRGRGAPKEFLWKKGQSGNPGGKPPIPQDVKDAKKLTDTEFHRVCSKLLFNTVSNLKKVVENDQTQVLEALVARILHRGITQASKDELNYFVERFLGKVAESHNFTGNINTGLVELLEQLKKQKELQNGKESEEEIKEVESF